ncbi:O-antigen ligase family protein [Chelatococcus reniformis]|uniref:O-antigen ligase-related domain-containing protein n=1 Tax=Chelatococcus reniformis TaxID=1494448 RepID=A0A916UGQ9_9HYPH|nr:O-antigen ligase family protein [Chelatococcus reniformis]GGC73106.1 hypothetical protein GCM10010994_34370 [Chelatococcus reniformis]
MGRQGRSVAEPATPLAQIAWLVLAAMPLMLAFANRSSVLVLVIAALVAFVGAGLSQGLPVVVEHLRGIVRSPFGLLFLAFLLLALASLTWAHDRPRSAFALAEAFIPALAAIALGAALPRQPERRAVPMLMLCLALAAIEVFVELITRLAWREALGLRATYFITNKPVLALVLLYWPLVPLTKGMARRWLLLAALAGVIAVTVFTSVSGTAMCALVSAAAAFVLALVAPRTARWAVMLAVAASLLVAPLKGELASRLIPDRALDALQSLHARDRVNIWLSFGEVVAQRPLTGTGFGSSAVVVRDPVASEVAADRRTLLDVGHPHDMFLQVWAELGMIGAALVGAALVVLWRTLARLGREQHAAGLAVTAAALMIALVGHGAWQGWWIAVAGAAVLWLWARPPVGGPVVHEEGAR